MCSLDVLLLRLDDEDDSDDEDMPELENADGEGGDAGVNAPVPGPPALEGARNGVVSS